MGNPNLNSNAMPVFLVNADPSLKGYGDPKLSDLSYEDQRVTDGFGYTVSTAVVAVSAGNYLVCELANPAGSGVNLFMTSRVMSHSVASGGAPLEYARYASTAAIATTPTPTVAPVNNRIAGGAASSATFRFNMTGTLPTGTTSSGGFIPTGGEEKRIKEVVIIPPGGKLIYVVGGGGGGLVAAARIVMTFLFYTRPA